MSATPISGAADLMREVNTFNAKVAAGIEKLNAIKDDQVEIATAAKDEIFRTDKVTLYRYRPLTEARFRTPMLIVYSLIGRHTMTDLQEDRSLVRNLLNQGMDLWVVDWGNASRADRWLTIDDYVSGYLDDCVTAMCEATGESKVSMLGICEGGVFAIGLCRARARSSAEPGADHYATRFPCRPERRHQRAGFHQRLDP